MTQPFSASFQVRWSDLDSNGHMANIAYMEYAMQSRFLGFQALGLSPKDLQDAMVGPVVFSDETRFYKELRLLDEFSVTFHVSHLSDDGERFTLTHDILRKSDQQRAAHVITQGAWFDLRTRKLGPPPRQVNEIMQRLLIPDAPPKA
jgi:acyl-CoA thioester hydrolase